MPTSEGGYPLPVTSRGTDTSVQACPRMRLNIDGQRPVTHRILRRRTASNWRTRLRAPIKASGRVKQICDSQPSELTERGPDASPVATAHWQYRSAGERCLDVRTGDEQREKRVAFPKRFSGASPKVQPIFDAPPPGLLGSGQAFFYKLPR